VKPEILKRIIISGSIFILTLFSLSVFAQLPTHVPSPEAEPVNFTDSWSSIILYIVIPVFVIVMFFIWRFRNKKNAQRQKQQDKDTE
jgi:heme/copper-type cytochrome/quinol oxidase subunit 2